MSTTTGPTSPVLDPGTFRAVMGALPTAVSIVASEESGSPIAMIMGTLTSVSLEPPLIAVLPMKTSQTWARIADTGRFVASVLSGQQRSVVDRLSGKSDSRFSSVKWEPSALGGPAVTGCLASIDAEIEAQHDAGDHLIVVARVRAARMSDVPGAPLVFFRRGFHRTLPVQDAVLNSW